jgi:hypothetical protein
VTEDLRQIVNRVRAIPYGRNVDRSAAGVRREGRGTCSTKHALLAELVDGVQLVHRICRIDRDRARELFGDGAAELVPPEGLVDVHTYATVEIEGRRTVIDVTFPSKDPWDGRSDMPLSCGDGVDVPATDDPFAQKAELVAEHCDPAVREPFIASLGG